MKRILLILITACLFVVSGCYPVLAANKITFPIGYYPDPTRGRPIALGELYIGDPDTDPTVVVNQKTVTALQEDGTEVAISQPISLSAGGVPVYLEVPVSLFTDGDYSLAVLNSGGDQKYYVPSTKDDSALSTNSIENIFDMVSISGQSEGDTASVLGYFDATAGDTPIGGGNFVWQATANKGTANGGTIIDPSNIGTFDGSISTRDSFLATQGTGVGSGCWVRQTPYDSLLYIFGCAGDGTTDDTAAIQAAFDSITYSGVVYTGTGTFVKDTVTTITGKSIKVYGDGAESSIFKCEDSNGFTITNTALTDKEPFIFYNIGFESDQDGTRTAITFSGQDTGALKGQLDVRSCVFSGISNATCWDIAVYMLEGDFSNFAFNYFKGSPATRESMTHALKLTDSVDVKIIGNYFYWMDEAISIEGVSEGITIKDSHFVPVTFGIVSPTTAGNLITIVDNHIAGFEGAIALGTDGVDAANLSHIRGNLIFKRSDSTNNFTAIRIDANKVELSGNEILITGAAAAGGTQKGIVLGPDATRCRVYGNNIYNMDTAIELEALSTNNSIFGNTYANNTTNITDAGTETINQNNETGNTVRGALVSYAVTEQDIVTATPTALSWTNEVRDTNAIYSAAAPTLLTVPAGITQVRIKAFISWESNATGDRTVDIQHESASTLKGLVSSVMAADGTSTVSLATAVLEVTPGDEFRVVVTQDSGGNLEIALSTWFEMIIQ